MKQKQRIIFLLVIVVLATVGVLYGKHRYIEYKKKPKLNPNPQYFLTIKGYISPKLSRTIQLAFEQTYAARNNKCSKVTNVLAGFESLPAKHDTYHIKPDKKGYYQVMIPMDKYLPGYCNWQPWELEHTLNKREEAYESPRGFSFISYDNEKSNSNNPKVFEYICKNALNTCRVKIPPHTYADIYIRTDRSFTQILNIKSQDEEAQIK